jgi:hypothetical protein
VSRENSAKCFSIFVDEANDISTTENFSLCVRYVDETEVKVCEQFLQFVSVSNTSGQELVNIPTESLKSFGIDLTYLRSPGCLGATSMGGRFKGAQSIVSSLFPKAPYVHCASHALNLATGRKTNMQSIRNCTGVMEINL